MCTVTSFGNERVTEIVGPGNVGRNNRTFLSYCLFVSDGGWKTRESIESTLGEKRGTINKLNQVRSRNLTWATADEGDGCQLRNPCSLHELPDCIRGSDCIMR